jgi:hypothetical protein
MYCLLKIEKESKKYDEVGSKISYIASKISKIKFKIILHCEPGKSKHKCPSINNHIKVNDMLLEYLTRILKWPF